MTLFTRKGDRGVFDQLFEWIDRLRSEGRYPFGLEELIGAIEGMVQDIGNTQVEDSVTRRLGFWLELAAGDDAPPNAVEAFQLNAFDILRILSLWRTHSADALVAEVEQTGISPPSDWKPRPTGSAARADELRVLRKLSRKMSALLESRREEHKLLNDKLKKLIDSMQELRSAGSPSSSMLEVVAAWVAASQDRLETPRLQPAERLPTPNDERDEIVANARSTWYVQVRFENTDISAAAIGKTIWALSSAIESVPGVVVKIESWESGSLVARLRVFIRNVWARDEVREVLHKGRNAAVAHYLDRPTEEAQKLRAEREKLEEEKRLLQQKADSYSTDAEKRITELNIAVKEEELRSQQLDNSLKAIELVERASSLVRDGLISADKLSIDINGLAYFLFDGRNVDTGEPMARIEQKEDVIADNDVPPAEQSDE